MKLLNTLIVQRIEHSVTARKIGVRISLSVQIGTVAQSVEHLVEAQGVSSSNLFSTTKIGM